MKTIPFKASSSCKEPKENTKKRSSQATCHALLFPIQGLSVSAGSLISMCLHLLVNKIKTPSCE